MGQDGRDNSPSNVGLKQPGRVTNSQPPQATPGAASSGYIQSRTKDAREDDMEEKSGGQYLRASAKQGPGQGQ